MAAHAGFQLWTVRRRFGAVLPVFACFFWFLCPLRADIVYLDDAGNVISSEKTELDEHGNVVVIPSEEKEEKTVTPPSGAGDKVADADFEKLELEMHELESSSGKSGLFAKNSEPRRLASSPETERKYMSY